jgi:hypothetical protein
MLNTTAMTKFSNHRNPLKYMQRSQKPHNQVKLHLTQPMFQPTIVSRLLRRNSLQSTNIHNNHGRLIRTKTTLDSQIIPLPFPQQMNSVQRNVLC